MKRTFEFNDEKSSKFWTIETNGNEFTVIFGKIGTAGQSQTKTFADSTACEKEVEKLIREKTKKGYAEQGEQAADTSNAKSADEIFELAQSDDKYLPLFIDYHRKLRPGGGHEQLGQIVDLLSDTDNGLRLLAACCVYAIDNQDIEHNIEDWMADFIGDDKKQQEKLFKYMLIEAANLPSRNEFLTDYFSEALDAMGIEYDSEALEELLEDIDVKKLPKLSAIRS
ncbi:hypothetical protein FACS189475_03160 [Betaproteobacteria bacterium]|nr:hypothetical protein FACS189475_03160 [Betaproteobacteria bacterium]